MKSALVRTAVITSLVTAFAVSLVSYYLLPHFAQVQPPAVQASDSVPGGVTVPAASTVPMGVAQPTTPHVVYRNRKTSPYRYTPAQPAAQYSAPAQTQDIASRDYSMDPAWDDSSQPQSSTGRSTQRDAYGEPITHQRRSTGKSVMIVAGSAGTGAALGAITGGGKGAAIGALAGGAAGLIFDRMTVNH
jgi:hypothetical protein